MWLISVYLYFTCICACVYICVNYKITNFLNCAIGKAKKMQRMCILQNRVGKMKKKIIFICVCQKKVVPLHQI